MTHTLQQLDDYTDGPLSVIRFTPAGAFVVVETDLRNVAAKWEQLPLVEARALWAALLRQGWVEFKLTPYQRQRAAQKANAIMRAGTAA